MPESRSSRSWLLLTVAGLVLSLTACSDDPVNPMAPAPPSGAIQDALHGAGNPFVFLKPPVVNEPSASEFGTFNPDLEPVVEVCKLDALGCAILTTNDGTGTEARYTVNGGPGGTAITVDLTAEEYQVPIHFSLFDLEENSTYRILTTIGERTLAYADVVLVSPREMKNADSENNIVFTNSMKTVPWKFRVDQGALCWEPDETVVSCESSVVTAGEEETVTLISSDGEEVVIYFPPSWSATVDGNTVDNLTISIEEVPADHGTAADPSCFASFSLSDPTTGEPANCYDIRADTDTETDVTVVFGGTLPVISFCPDQDVLQAIANGTDGYLMTSVEDDTQGAVRRTYANVAPVDFGGCTLPPPTVSFGDGAVGQFAALVWQRIRPVIEPLLPAPLYAVDLGFGGELPQLSTIFFWARTPDDIAVTPASTSVAVGQTVQLSADPVYHDGAGAGSGVAVQWSSSDPTVATVDASGLVTGVGDGNAQVTATATDVQDPLGSFLADVAAVTVTANTASISGQVTDETSQPITGASVLVQGTNTAVVTDANGQYSLTGVQAGTVTLEASYVGYFTQTASLNTVGGQSYVADFQLAPSTNLTLDQSNTTHDGTTYSSPGGSLWQSFTPTVSSMGAVKLGFRVGGSFPQAGYTSTVRIRSGTPTGTVLATATGFVASATGGSSIEVTHTLTSPVALTPGATYVIEWVSADAAIVTWFGGPNNPYAGGEALNGSGTPYANDVDFVFWTYDSQ